MDKAPSAVAHTCRWELMTVGVGMLNACEDTADKASSRVGRIEVEESMTMVDNVRQ